MPPTVLIVTKSNDNASPALVQAALEARGARVFRFDTDRFPTELQLALHQPVGRSTIRSDAGELVLGELSAAWYRRSAIGAGLPADMDPQHRGAAVHESRATLYGMLESLECFVMDRISTVRAAEHKPHQLALAHALGLDVPATLTTNDPAAARAFWDRCAGRVVGKMLSSFAIRDDDGRESVVFTSPLSAADLAELDQLALSPMTFQEQLAKRVELRVTVIGGRVFAAAVDSQAVPAARTDWRKAGRALLHAWTPYTLPDDVATRLQQLAARLGLAYGAADFVVTPDGRHVFLEINPAGEWFWLDDVFGPRALSAAIADTLLAGGAHAPGRGCGNASTSRV
jgi:glutathione synthase/RimK-type ligase-like ATP-grasp enzyme